MLLLGFNLAHAQITLDITKGASGAGIPITIAPFGGTSEDIAGIIASDLKRTGKIAPQPPQSQADYAVTGQVRSGGRGAIVQFQLTGVQGGKLLDLSFDVPSEQLRPVAHRISDLIYEKLTGEKGLAGTRIAFDELARIVAAVRPRGGLTIVDEIYLGLSYDDPALGAARSALELGDDVLVVNSFSKYFGMTGWRLGWLVLPPALVAPIEKLAQNLYICASSVAQHAAVECFHPDSLAECERRRDEMRARRDFVVPALEALGLPVPVTPDGAFYVWFDTSRHAADSWTFCFDMMERAHVALTPGRDFGLADTGRYARLSFASALPQLRSALGRLERVLAG